MKTIQKLGLGTMITLFTGIAGYNMLPKQKPVQPPIDYFEKFEEISKKYSEAQTSYQKGIISAQDFMKIRDSLMIEKDRPVPIILKKA